MFYTTLSAKGTISFQPSNGTTLVRGNIKFLFKRYMFFLKTCILNTVSINYIAKLIIYMCYVMIWSLMPSKLLTFFSSSIHITYREKIISRLITSILIGTYWRFTTLGLKVPFGYFINMTDLSLTERKHYLTFYYWMFFNSLAAVYLSHWSVCLCNHLFKKRKKEKESYLLFPFPKAKWSRMRLMNVEIRLGRLHFCWLLTLA